MAEVVAGALCYPKPIDRDRSRDPGAVSTRHPGTDMSATYDVPPTRAQRRRTDGASARTRNRHPSAGPPRYSTSNRTRRPDPPHRRQCRHAFPDGDRFFLPSHAPHDVHGQMTQAARYSTAHASASSSRVLTTRSPG